VVVYFYPADDTPGCTKEACQFNENSRFSRAAPPSSHLPDRAEKHTKFRTKYGLTFPLLSDPSHGVMEAYGAWARRRCTARRRPAPSARPSSSTPRAPSPCWYNVRAEPRAKVLEELGALEA